MHAETVKHITLLYDHMLLIMPPIQGRNWSPSGIW